MREQPQNSHLNTPGGTFAFPKKSLTKIELCFDVEGCYSSLDTKSMLYDKKRFFFLLLFNKSAVFLTL